MTRSNPLLQLLHHLSLSLSLSPPPRQNPSPCLSLPYDFPFFLRFTMSPLFLLPLSLLFLLPISFSQSLRGIFINCGATQSSYYQDREWLPDDGFITAGTPKNVTDPDVFPILSTVRSFALEGNLNKKFCYEFPVYRGAKYLLRTTYYYGGINESPIPPVFDQMVDGTFWTVVNTTSDYENKLSTYYEGIFGAAGKMMSVCVGANNYTDSDPYVSAIEVILLDDSVYNSTDFEKFGLSLVARNNFGERGSIVRYPDDQFDRIWQPFGSYNPVDGAPNISVSGFWNLPPLRIFETRMSLAQPGELDLQWPPGPLPTATYYMALYFANDPVSPSGNSRLFSISINGMKYYNNLNVTHSGVVVFANQWPLDGLTNIAFIPAAGSNVAPLINAAEAFILLSLGGNTHTRDVIALERIRSKLQKPPSDWKGDPCLPIGYSWSGVTCSSGRRIRVVALNLMNRDISGSLSPYTVHLTALNSVLLGGNRLSGGIPDFSKLKHLQILGLENNKFSGTIPSSLGNMSTLRELHLENNNLYGQIPKGLIGKSELNFTYTPGNNLSSPPVS